MRRMLFAGIAALLALVTGLYLVVVRPALLPSDDTPRAERALATPDLVVLGSVNVKQAVFLEKWFLGSPVLEAAQVPNLPAVPDRTLLDHLRAAGVSPRSDLDQLLFALYRPKDAVPRRAIVLLGRFDAAAIGSYLARELRAVPRTEGGRTVYDVTRPDPTTCEPTATWAIAVDAGWILVADATSLPDLLSRMTGDPHDADATLAWWQPLAHADVLGLGIVDPKQAGAAVAQSLLEAASQSLSAEAEGVDHAYLGLGVSPVPPQGRLRLVIEAAAATNV